jgi:hypothetical protein
LLLYLAWCTTVFAIIMCLVIAISSASGYFVMIYKICSDFRNDQKYVFVVLCVIFFPLAFLVGILVTIAIIMQKIFFIYLSLALSAKLFPCYVYWKQCTFWYLYGWNFLIVIIVIINQKLVIFLLLAFLTSL